MENEVCRCVSRPAAGQITGVTLKDYTKYAPRGERNQLIELLDPATARFGLSFYVKNGLRNIPVNTLDYVFTAEPGDDDRRRCESRRDAAAGRRGVVSGVSLHLI